MFVLPLPARRVAFVPALSRPALRRPAMDVAEADAAYTLTFDLPGLRREQIELRIEGDRLHIASASAEPGENSPRIVWRERADTRFARSLTLPDDVNRDAIDARFADGVLTVTLPKTAKAGSVRVPVN